MEKLFSLRIKKLEKWLKQEKLLLDSTRLCKLCFEKINNDSIHHLIKNDSCLCSRCYSRFDILDKTIKTNGVSGKVLYRYNETLKETIYKLKGCGDIEMAPIFLDYRLFFLKIKFRNFVIVPAPSSYSDDKKRGFNHVVEIFKYLKLPIINGIRKKMEFKQSDLDAKNRSTIIDKLELVSDNGLKGKNVLIVDDVMTTGSTINAMISLIKSAKANKICFLVICRPDFK